MKRFSKIPNSLTVLVVGLAMLSLTGCDSDSTSDPVTLVEVASDGGFSTLVAAVEAADLTSTLEGDGPFTIFAPTEAAFSALPVGTLSDLLLPENKATLASILTYHVVAGRITSDQVVNLTSATTVQGETISIEAVNGAVKVNGANVTSVDIEADNGVIHVIDQVLLPPSSVDAKRGSAAGQQTDNIVDIALGVNADSGEFSVLIDALGRADLVGALQADDQFTVFAPTDAAFVALLGELGATSLDDIDLETLKAVLLYHVAPGRRFSNSVLRARQIPTLNGEKIYVKRGSATIVDANGREANILVNASLFDIPASNGVIHVIDRVILP